MILIEKETDESMKSIKACISHFEAKLFRKNNLFPDGTLVQFPRKDQAIMDTLEGFFGTYTHALKLNLRFPLLGFMVQLLQYYRVGLNQLNPNVIELVNSFYMLCRLVDMSPSVHLFNFFGSSR